MFESVLAPYHPLLSLVRTLSQRARFHLRSSFVAAATNEEWHSTLLAGGWYNPCHGEETQNKYDS
jgi:hypothetical protein